MITLELRKRLEEVEKADRPEGPARELRDRLAKVTGEELVTLCKSEAEDLACVLSELVDAEDDPGKLRQLLQKVKDWLSGANLLTNLKVPRVDLVTHPANRRTFLITKHNETTGEEDLVLEDADWLLPPPPELVTGGSEV